MRNTGSVSVGGDHRDRPWPGLSGPGPRRAARKADCRIRVRDSRRGPRGMGDSLAWWPWGPRVVGGRGELGSSLRPEEAGRRPGAHPGACVLKGRSGASRAGSFFFCSSRSYFRQRPGPNDREKPVRSHTAPTHVTHVSFHGSSEVHRLPALCTAALQVAHGRAGGRRDTQGRHAHPHRGEVGLGPLLHAQPQPGILGQGQLPLGASA